MFKSVLAAAATLALAAGAHAQNLVTNGGFESGNTAFNSDYTLNLLGPNAAAGEYTVTGSASGWNSWWVGSAHSGSSMFLANGSTTTGAVVWEQSVSGIQANTNYFFEAWVMNACCNSGYPAVNDPVLNAVSILTFQVNGVDIATRTTTFGNPGTWEGLSNTWNSGSTTGSVVLKLINSQAAAGGNDFAVDDISLSTIQTITSVSAVPEPSAYLMALFGLGALGAAARRRNHQA